MARPRDSQRSRQYASEWEVFGWPKEKFNDMGELEEYLWKVLENRHVVARILYRHDSAALLACFSFRHKYLSHSAKASVRPIRWPAGT